ncbi:MAG: hypothetical protein Q8L48_03660 [Archangium sp.]|nr:hypothetical protein [Archangium sp.]
MFGRLARVGAVVAVVLVGAGCGKKAVPDVDLSNAEPRVLLLPEQHEPAAVRAAIIAAMQTRGWVAEAENAGDIVARLSHKGATVRVDLVYAGDRVTIKGLLAEGAGRNYEKWVGNLEASIREALKPAVAAAPPPPAVTPAPTMAVFEAKQKPEAVKVALQRALSQHSWVMESEQGDSLVARLNHRRGMVRVRISYDTAQASIAYLDSQELSFDAAGRNDEYEKWMRNLVDSIRGNTR